MTRSNTRIHGAKAGDRRNIIRLRSSDTELQYMDAECERRGTTRAYSMRLALVKDGLFPKNIPLYDKKHALLKVSA
jgi:hypothetical protein